MFPSGKFVYHPAYIALVVKEISNYNPSTHTVKVEYTLVVRILLGDQPNQDEFIKRNFSKLDYRINESSYSINKYGVHES